MNIERENTAYPENEIILNEVKPKMNKAKILILAAILLSIMTGLVIGYVAFKDPVPPPLNQATVTSVQQENESINQSRQTAITRAIERVAPAIVGINVEEEREVRSPFANDPFFRQFFGDMGPQTRIVRGLGSGFLISDDGYIITNDHVAGNATKISVTLTTGETIDARLIGSDPVSDVALLKIDKGGLNYVPLGNSDDVIIGEWVIALGNPFGLFEINDKPSVTVGVVSATDMRINAAVTRVFSEMIQTDDSINSGNSGGPLINADGNVIGVNTIIYTGGQFSTGSIGVGFAISVNRVKQIVDELRRDGSIDRNFNVGFRIQGIDDRIANYLNLPSKEGVIVTQVLRGSISERAGLRPEDVIVTVNDQKIRSEQDLLFTINDMRVGDMLRMEIIRGGERRAIEFRLTAS
jgi:serine protease Do